MIKTLSPYYLNIPLENPLTGEVCNSYILHIYVWNGSKTAVPDEPSYTMTKINAAGSDSSEKVNIARIVNDFIEFDCNAPLTTSILNGNNQVWVRYEVFYDDVPSVPGMQGVQLAIKGYGFFLEGENPQPPTNKVLLTGDEFKVNRNGMFVLPVLAKEPTVAARTLMLTNFARVTDGIYDATASANFAYSQLYIYVRAVGSSTWVPTVAAGDNYEVPEDIASDVFEVRASAFDVVTSQTINSSTYTITALKIYQVAPFDGGHGINVYYHRNITTANVNLQIYGYSGPTWSDNPYDANSPRAFSFTPTGDFIIRLKVGDNLSNEVPLTIPLTDTINIP